MVRGFGIELWMKNPLNVVLSFASGFAGSLLCDLGACGFPPQGFCEFTSQGNNEASLQTSWQHMLSRSHEGLHGWGVLPLGRVQKSLPCDDLWDQWGCWTCTVCC